MAKYFNTAGPCSPERHYMLPPELRLPAVRQLAEQGFYFVVHAPRQSGKTTLVRALAQSLTASGRFAALATTCENGQPGRDDVERGLSSVIETLQQDARLDLPAELQPPAADDNLEPTTRLRELLIRWAQKSPLPVVLFLDEIDTLLDDTLFSVLRQLRSGYPRRPTQFPHAVALVGLRDVRDYRLREGEDRAQLGTSSPFNIKVESLTLPNFSAAEVAALYRQHTSEKGQEWSPDALARAYELTGGQPWLVNALAREVVDKVAPDPSRKIAVDAIEKAKEALILRRDTHLDSLVDRLRDPRVRQVIEPILAGGRISPDVYDDDLQFVVDLGLVSRGSGGLEIANPIYHEVIPRALAAQLESILPPIARGRFLSPAGELDPQILLDEFRAFWCENADFFLRRQPYSEAAAELIFMAFLQRVVNGGGSIQREYGVGSGRIDLLVTWPTTTGQQRLAIELKVWHDKQSDPLDRGLVQLEAYLAKLQLEEGILILFDRRAAALPLPQRCAREKRVFANKRITLERL